MPDTYMTLKEVAELLKISERSVYRLAKDGKLPGFKPGGGAWRFRRSDVEAWVDDQIAAGRAGGEDRGEA